MLNKEVVAIIFFALAFLCFCGASIVYLGGAIRANKKYNTLIKNRIEYNNKDRPEIIKAYMKYYNCSEEKATEIVNNKLGVAIR